MTETYKKYFNFFGWIKDGMTANGDTIQYVIAYKCEIKSLYLLTSVWNSCNDILIKFIKHYSGCGRLDGQSVPLMTSSQYIASKSSSRIILLGLVFPVE